MKMVLIPESEYRRLKPEGGIKDKLDKILTGKRDKKAATEMTQLFGRYLRMSKPDKLPKPLDKMEIVRQLPPIYHEKVANFLTQLENYGTRWTDKYQLISKSGEMIGDTLELLKEAFVGTRRVQRQVPVGWTQFVKEIVDAKIPPGILTKKSTRRDIQEEIEKGMRWERY